MANTTVYYPIIALIAVGVIIALIAIISQARKGARKSTSQYQSHRKETYAPGQFSSQMELDLRLPYHRFKQLYPESNLTYEQYKKLQMQSAFRRSRSSQENKRMVR